MRCLKKNTMSGNKRVGGNEGGSSCGAQNHNGVAKVGRDDGIPFGP